MKPNKVTQSAQKTKHNKHTKATTQQYKTTQNISNQCNTNIKQGTLHGQQTQ